jgi:hypothetical protein
MTRQFTVVRLAESPLLFRNSHSLRVHKPPRRAQCPSIRLIVARSSARPLLRIRVRPRVRSAAAAAATSSALALMSDDDADDGVASDTLGKQAGDNSQIEVYGRLRPSNKNDKSVCIMNDGEHVHASHITRRQGRTRCRNTSQRGLYRRADIDFDLSALPSVVCALVEIIVALSFVCRAMRVWGTSIIRRKCTNSK